MSITDGLRFYVCRLRDEGSIGRACEKNLLDTADRIDAAHKQAVDKAHADGERNGLQQARSASEDWQRGFDAGFASGTDDWLAEHEDAMVEHGWVKLPVDADGVPIRIGDEMRVDGEPECSRHRVVGMELRDTGRWSIDLLEYGISALCPDCAHHTQPDTWERIIEDAICGDGRSYGCLDERIEAIAPGLVARCRALAGEGE